MLGELKHHPRFASHYVAPRNVEVWLPPHYQDTPSRRFPVIYMHDGQNLFNPQTSLLRVDWGIDEALGRLISEQRARAAIGEGVRHPVFVPFRLTAIRDRGARKRRGRRQALLVRRPAAAPGTKATVP